MKKFTGLAAVAGLLAVAACDDGRQERIPGVEPGFEAQPADTVWADTLHPPVPPAPGVESPDPATLEPSPGPAAPGAPPGNEAVPPAGTAAPPGGQR